jgi:hypothetical protein
MDSFYICDDEWNKEKEVTCMDMGSDSDEDIWIMDDTQLDELLDEEGQRMKFVFDYMTERFFKVKLKEVVPGKALHDPLCERKVGNPPAENVDISEFITIPKIPDANNIEAIDKSEFYGDEEYDEDEISDYEELDDFDYRNTITRLEVPAYFISGEYDYNCPWELVDEYCEGLDAPAKGFYKIKDSAHSPLWENAGDSMEIMKNIREMTENGR